MTLARHRSIRTITAFRARYHADHPCATEQDAGLAYVMQASRLRAGSLGGRAEPLGSGEQRDYAAFIAAARSSFEEAVEPPHGLKWPEAPAQIRAVLGI